MSVDVWDRDSGKISIIIQPNGCFGLQRLFAGETIKQADPDEMRVYGAIYPKLIIARGATEVEIIDGELYEIMPQEMNMSEIRRKLAQLNAVAAVHDL